MSHLLLGGKGSILQLIQRFIVVPFLSLGCRRARAGLVATAFWRQTGVLPSSNVERLGVKI